MNLTINKSNYIKPQFKSKKIKKSEFQNIEIQKKSLKNDEFLNLSNDFNKSKAKKQNFNKKTVFALSLLGLSLVCAFSFAKKQKSVFLSPKINFTPSKTIEEAREFARNELKIKDYFLNDLDCANYINESIAEFNNRSKDKKRIIDVVVPFENDSLTASLGHGLFKRVLFINEKVLKREISPSLDDIGLIKTALLNPAFELSENQKEIFNKLLKNPKELSISEKVQANFYLTQLDLFFSKTFSKSRVENPKTKIPECSKFHICFHEIGHEFHRSNIGKKLFRKYNYYGKDASAISLFMAKERFKEELGREDFMRILKNVSYYAAISPDELIAEVFSGVVSGIKYDDKIMELFEKYGGILPF